MSEVRLCVVLARDVWQGGSAQYLTHVYKSSSVYEQRREFQELLFSPNMTRAKSMQSSEMEGEFWHSC